MRKPNDQPKSKPANSEEQLSLCCSFVSLKQYVILCDRFQTIEPKVKQDALGLIEEFIAIHGNDVSPLFGVELFHKPRSRGFCNLACGNQEHMIEQDLPISFGIENRMINGHSRLR